MGYVNPPVCKTPDLPAHCKTWPKPLPLNTMAQRSNLSDDTYLAILDRVSAGELVTDVVKDFGATRTDVWRKSEEERTEGNGHPSSVSSSAYMRARIAQAHSIAEDTILIADGRDDDGAKRLVAMVESLAGVDDDDKERLLNSLALAAVQRDKLRVDTRKFLLAKIAPRIYGDTTRHVELTGKDGGSIQVEDVTALQAGLTARLAGIASRRRLLSATVRVLEPETVDAEVVAPDETA